MGELKYSIKALEEMEKMYDKSLSIIGDRDDVVTNGTTDIQFKDVIFTDSKLILCSRKVWIITILFMR